MECFEGVSEVSVNDSELIQKYATCHGPGKAVRIGSVSESSENNSEYISSAVEPSKKRHCSGTTGVELSNENLDANDVSSIIQSVKTEFVQEISKMLKETKLEEASNITKDRNEITSLAYFIQKADTLEALKPRLIDNHFTIDTHKNMIVYDVCVDDPYSNSGGFYAKQAGIFNFDFDAYFYNVELSI